MIEQEIQKEVNALIRDMMDRGLARPVCTAMIDGASEPRVYLHWDEEDMTYGRTEFGRGNSMTDALGMARDILASIPPKEDREKAEFTRLLAKAIDKGRSIGIEVEFLNPLTDMMKRLSENAITHAAD